MKGGVSKDGDGHRNTSDTSRDSSAAVTDGKLHAANKLGLELGPHGNVEMKHTHTQLQADHDDI